MVDVLDGFEFRMGLDGDGIEAAHLAHDLERWLGMHRDDHQLAFISIEDLPVVSPNGLDAALV